MNEGLFTAYQSLPAWKRLMERIGEGGCTALYEIAEGERPFLAAALSHATGRPVLLVAPTELIAQRQAQDIERLTGDGCAMLPARDIQFSRAAMSRESAWQRLSVLDGLTAGRVKVLCASVDALLDRCAPRARFQSAAITLSEGGRIAPDGLMEALIRGGYERVPMVEGRGQCAMRGAIVDVFPANAADALRIEFFDDEIDSLRRFDCISQRSIARVKGARIAPATECLVADAQAAADRLKAALEKGVGHAMESAAPEHAAPGPDGLSSLDDFLSGLDALEATEDLLAQPQGNDDGARSDEAGAEARAAWKRHLDDVDRVRAGQVIRTAPMWMNVLLDDTALVTDYLDDPIVLLDRPDQYQVRLRAAADALLATGLHRVFISLGGDGVFAADRSGERVHLPVLPAEMVNTTGCGDAFMAAITWAYLQGTDLEHTALAGLGASAIAMEGAETINPAMSAEALKLRAGL